MGLLGPSKVTFSIDFAVQLTQALSTFLWERMLVCANMNTLAFIILQINKTYIYSASA